ncbi:hypothetical protein CDD82_3346 [Ophiocordyceps australis]|uniref:F-box domain-containing protein n=1 Tax=Ophiocordyceps australis TaxID=1399860 RepID=A0A2C5ZDN0_9HYPO|nr:hypothetical protein CDD82_3346 [Ophiocordyceps australis]
MLLDKPQTSPDDISLRLIFNPAPPFVAEIATFLKVHTASFSSFSLFVLTVCKEVKEDSSFDIELKMASNSTKTTSLASVPVEILLEIYRHLDMDSVFNICLTSKSFQAFFEQRKALVLIPILEREFSPFSELLQVYTASPTDVDIQSQRCKPRRIAFRRFIGDQGIVLNHVPASQPVYSEKHGHDLYAVVGCPSRNSQIPTRETKTTFLSETDLRPLMRMCQLIRKWEELFPHMRWFREPGNCRFLRAHEQFRFRRALYRWWLYGIYFHGDHPRPRIGLPQPFASDARISQMRIHSTAELLELMDLLETVKDVIFNYICPRLDPEHQNPWDSQPYLYRAQSLAISWSDQSLWGRIVKTYFKLGPGELLYYFENICSYPRDRLISEIRLGHPGFTLDQESMQIAIRCALDERQWLALELSLADEAGGGIIDFDDERDEERHLAGGDASPAGVPPEGSKLVQTSSRYSPRGDDGSHVESYYSVHLAEPGT